MAERRKCVAQMRIFVVFMWIFADKSGEYFYLKSRFDEDRLVPTMEVLKK